MQNLVTRCQPEWFLLEKLINILLNIDAKRICAILKLYQLVGKLCQLKASLQYRNVTETSENISFNFLSNILLLHLSV